MKKKMLCIITCTIMILCLLAGCGSKDETTHNHTYDTAWSYDMDYHWHKATCEHSSEKSSYEAHSYTDDVCTVCGYEKESQTPPEPIKYTILFDANGGVFEDGKNLYSVEVNEGEKLEIPSSPTKDGHTFTQWYKNSSLEEPWDFENDTVTNTTTLYAGWDAVIIEHDVTFVLNYDNMENVVQSTTNGLVTCVPERPGYVFNGWWISDGQTIDGEYILAQKWDTSEIVTENGLILYAEWVEASTVSSQLPAPSVSIAADVFSWTAIENAVRYDIRVYKSGSNEEITSDSVTGTSWTFPSGYEAGYYTVKIRAIGDGLNTVNSVYVSKSYGHHILSSISKIDFDISTSVLTWTTVKNATAYELYINNELVDELTYTTYDMSHYEAGNYEIKIVATRNDYQSSTTTRQIEKKRLKTPTPNLYVDSENGVYTLMWDRVNYADTYTLVFNGTEVNVSDQLSYSFDNSAAFWDENNSVKISMTAFDSNADYLISLASADQTAKKIYTITVDKNVAEVGGVTTNTTTTEAGTTVTEGAIYISQTFKIEFDLNGATGTIASQNVTATKALTYPSIPTRDGYIFKGWYTDKSCTELYDFSAEITKDWTLYAGWTAINTSGYGNYTLDVVSNYYSSSRAYTVSTSGTSSSNAKYMYFRALTDGTYTLYYKNSSSSSSYGTYFYVYNLTQGTTLNSNTKVTSTSYKSLTLDLKAGDIVYIRNYAYSSSYSATFSFYVTGAKTPTAGGLATDRYLIKGNEDSESTLSKIYAEINTPITITASTKDNRYTFIGWYDGNTLLTNDLNYSFTLSDSNINYTAKWSYYSVTTEKNIDEAGTVTSYSYTPVGQGQNVTITATTNSGYTWDGWYNGDTLLTTDLSYTFEMTEQNVVYTAKWSCYTLTTTTNDTNAGTYTTKNAVKTTEGTSITLTASTKSGYTWLGWYNGDELLTSETSYKFDMPAESITYTAKWACYTITTQTNNSEAGTFTTKNNVKTRQGASVTLTASTKNGYTWLGWYNGDVLVSSSLSYTFTMPGESIVYTAKWIECPVTLLKSDDAAGTVGGINNKTYVGEETTITATTNNGYTWLGWYNGATLVSSNLSYTFAMPSEPVTYTAKWIECPVTIEKSIEQAGSVSGMGNTTCLGEEITIIANTNSSYVWLGWYNGENKLTDEYSYTFTVSTEKITYTAKWIECPVTVNANSNVAGSISSMNGQYKLNQNVTITSTTNDGYTWLGWYNGDTLLTSDASYTFKLTDDVITYTAKWCVDIKYINENGAVVQHTDANIQYISTSGNRTLTGWYLLSGEVSGTSTLTVNGEAHIILADGCDWTINALTVPEGNAVHIYAQSDNDNCGILNISKNLGGQDGKNGENAGTIVINGGVISAENIGGGNGQSGTNGTNGTAGTTGSNGVSVDLSSSYDSSKLDGKTGGKGTSGTSGTNGGTGGNVESIVINGGTITATNIGGGNGANGGSGGSGGAGGKGGNGYSWPSSSTRYTGGGDGGTGGVGGNGGNGGNGGAGGNVGKLIINNGYISATRIGGGNGGNGGSSGAGGRGGNGGKGGDGALDTSGIVAYQGCAGGNGGRGGNSGDAGDAGAGGNAEILINGGTVIATVQGGNCGSVGTRASSGSGGYGGNPGYKLNTSTKGKYGTDGYSGNWGAAGEAAAMGECMVFFNGTETEWPIEGVETANTTVYYYSETTPTTDGNYWHYDVDSTTPVIWEQETTE